MTDINHIVTASATIIATASATTIATASATPLVLHTIVDNAREIGIEPSTLTQTVLSLISGIIGSVIGAGATVWATQKNIKETAKYAKDAERERIELEEQQRVEQAKNWISAEILQINEMLNTGQNKRKLPVSAWDSTKMYFYWWTEEEQKSLVALYNEVELFNAQVDFWMHGQSESSKSNHPGQLTACIQRLRPELVKTIKVLKISVG